MITICQLNKQCELINRSITFAEKTSALNQQQISACREYLSWYQDWRIEMQKEDCDRKLNQLAFVYSAKDILNLFCELQQRNEKVIPFARNNPLYSPLKTAIGQIHEWISGPDCHTYHDVYMLPVGLPDYPEHTYMIFREKGLNGVQIVATTTLSPDASFIVDLQPEDTLYNLHGWINKTASRDALVVYDIKVSPNNVDNINCEAVSTSNQCL